MNSARRELDRMSYETWGQLVSDVKTGGKSMGRVSLSYARHHPALLLGGGALLGLAAVSMFARKKPDPAPAAAAPPAKASRKPAWTGLLMNVGKMWLLDTLAAEFRVEQDKQAKGESDGDDDGDGERENELDPRRAQSIA
jgi:hypothetical protein